MAGAAYQDDQFHTNPNLDPLQGYDIKVYTGGGALTSTGTETGSGHLLVGAFTSAMFKVVNQTETYLPLNSRLPKHLDGEIILVYALEQGMISPSVISNTYGGALASALSQGRGFKIPRSQRFNVTFEANLYQDLSPSSGNGQDPSVFYNNNFTTVGTEKDSLRFTLKQCRVDTFSFGMTAGRHIVANSWQGTAESIKVEIASTSTGTAITN